MAEQLAFDWPTRVALGPDDFFVSEANAQAYAMVTAWQDWPEGKLALVGPKGSGKTHLARLFQQLTDAQIVQARDLGQADLAPPTTAALVVEDAEDLPPAGQEWLFHAHNHLRHAGGRLLLTSTIAPSRWPLTLPDLASRMQATNVTRITDPDDQLLGAVLLKLFQDRQLAPAPAAFAYLTSHMERSFAGAARLVDAIDREALATQKPITRSLAARVLDNLPPAD